MLRTLRLALLALAVCAWPAAAPAIVVPGEAALAPKQARPAPMLRLAPKAAPQGVRLAPVREDELEMLRARNRNAQTARKRLAVGLERAVGAASGAEVAQWTPVAGGFAAQVSLTSPEAGALRVAIDLANVPGDVEMVFFGSEAPDILVGPVRVGDIKDRMVPWWSPITDGETQTVEFFAPGKAPGARVRLVEASHVFTTLASGLKKRVVDIGDAGACNVDIKCSSLQSSQAFLNARNAVAQMVLVDNGTTYLCTGTLLNDTAPATQIPWFFSANHCFDNESTPLKTPGQMQGVANSLNTLWFFEAQTCGTHATPNYVQLFSGAEFIYNNPKEDTLFLRLIDAAPAGAFFSAWSSSAPAVGTSVTAIHHPSGDLKKVSQGSVVNIGVQPPVPGGTTMPFQEVRWSSGTTEGGSSGSGLFTFDGSQYLLRGGLWGGSAQCTNPNGTDYFSRLDQVYSALLPYLNPSTGPAYDFTDLWWNPGESGWGLNLIQHANGIVFAMWYTYDSNGKMTWYHVPSGTWTDPMTYSGTLVAVAGPAFSTTFNSSQVKRTAVGTATLRFTSATTGTWTYSVDGMTGTKAIERLPF